MFKQNRTVHKYIWLYGVAAVFLVISVFFSGCDQIQKVTAPATLKTPDDTKSIKIGFFV